MRFLWLAAALVLATCIALGGPLRAVELVDLDDSHTITAPASDEFIATTASKPVAPPRCNGTLPAQPLTFGPGRLAIVELFRPPQAA